MDFKNVPQVPTHLQHKPIYMVNDYNWVDNPKDGDSDALGLSIGLAQWNDRFGKDISAKVWRHTRGADGEFDSGKWSRQSEELPLHRVLDLAIFICMIMNEKDLSTPVKFVEEDIFLEESNIENFGIYTELLKEFLGQEQEKDRLDKRLRILAQELRQMGY